MSANNIVLNTVNELRTIRFLAKHVETIQGRVFVNDVIEDVLDCLLNRFTALQKLHDYVKEIHNSHFEYGRYILSPLFAPLLERLGKTIYAQLVALHLYQIDGILPYHHLRLEDSSVNDIILARTHELTYYTSSNRKVSGAW
jgi:hypothetical protein